MSNNDKAVRKELDQQIGRVGKSLATEKDQEKRRQLRDQGRNLVRRRSYHVDDNEIVSYAGRKEEVFLDDLMDVLMDEEWKPFPKDKVNRSLDRKKKKAEKLEKEKSSQQDKDTLEGKRKKQKAVYNHRTRMTDSHKAIQKFTGKDRQKYIDRTNKHDADTKKAFKKAQKQIDKQSKAQEEHNKKRDQASYDKVVKHHDKAVKHRNKGERSRQRANAMKDVFRTWGHSTRDEYTKQAEINKKSKEDRAKAERALKASEEKERKAAPLEKAYQKPAVKGATKGGFRKEAMNFTDYCDSLVEPIFEVKGALPKCPPGYKYSPQQKQCVPKTDKDDVRLNKGGSKDSNPSNGPGYNVWGRTGVNGDGYAWAEPNNWETDAYDGPSGGMYN